jgi:hypothetical protein
MFRACAHTVFIIVFNKGRIHDEMRYFNLKIPRKYSLNLLITY